MTTRTKPKPKRPAKMKPWRGWCIVDEKGIPSSDVATRQEYICPWGAPPAGKRFVRVEVRRVVK